ncbi:MAG: Ig-like domain-containing protein [Myxococcota bacterium]
MGRTNASLALVMWMSGLTASVACTGPGILGPEEEGGAGGQAGGATSSASSAASSSGDSTSNPGGATSNGSTGTSASSNSGGASSGNVTSGPASSGSPVGNASSSGAPDGGSAPGNLEVTADPEVTICAGGAATIGPEVVDGYQYTWVPTDGLSAPQSAQPSASPTTTTTYQLTVTDPATGAQGTAQVQVTVLSPPVAHAGAPRSICTGQSTTLGSPAEPGLTYQWSHALSPDLGSTAELTVTPEATTTYRLLVSDAAGCTSSSEVEVVVRPLPVASAGPDATLRIGSPTTLSASAEQGTPPYAFQWSSDNAACVSSPCIDTLDAPQTLVQPQDNTLFTVTVTDASGCSAQDSVLVTVDDALWVEAGVDAFVCAGESVSLLGSATGGVAPYMLSWAAEPACGAPDCISDPNVSAPTVTPSGTTTFTLTVTDAQGAQQTDQVIVNVAPSPGTAGADASVLRGGTVRLGATATPGATYQWSCNRPECALSDATAADPLATPLRSTSYQLTATGPSGCEEVSSVTVQVGLHVTIDPPDGTTDYPVSSTLQVFFDEEMDPTTLNSDTVQLRNAGSGALLTTVLQYDAAGSVLTIVPTDAGYTYDTDYTLVVVGGVDGVKSADAVMPSILLFNEQVDFSTVAADTTPPGTSFRAPDDGDTGVPLGTSVVAVLDEAVRPETVNETTFTLTGPDGQVTATVSYDPTTRTATLTPGTTLAALTTYVVDLVGVMDLSDNASNEDWSFTTGAAPDTTPPTVVAISPPDGATDVSAGTVIEVTFDEAVDVSTLGNLTLTNLATGIPVVCTVRYDATTHVATWTPTSILDGTTQYRVTLSDVADLSGNLLAAPVEVTFTTRVRLFLDDFESGTGAWTLAPGTNGVAWGLATNTSRSPAYSLTDSPDEKYGNDVSSAAELANPILLPGVTSVSLQFALRTRLERNRDFFALEYQLDDGAWVQVDKPGTTSAWSGNQPWTVWTVLLDATGATQLRLRFRVDTNESRVFDGVYVDDVLVETP